MKVNSASSRFLLYGHTCMFSMKRIFYVNKYKHARFQVSDAKASTVSMAMVLGHWNYVR